MTAFVPRPLSNPDPFMVGVGVRIVPAGVTSDGQFIRASVVLSPVAADSAAATCGKKIDLRQWPELIEAMLYPTDVATIPGGAAGSNLEVTLSPVKDGTTRPEPTPASVVTLNAFRAMFHDQPVTKGKAADIGAWREQRKTDIQAIGEMWRRLIAPNGDTEWDSIMSELRSAQASSRLKNLRPNSDAPNPGPPDIRGLGRGQAALLLSLERGRSLLMRTQQHISTPGVADRDSESNLAALGFGMRSHLTEAERAKAGPEGSPTRSAAEAKAKHDYDLLSGEDRQKRDDLLTKDREELEKASQEARATAAAKQQKNVEAKWSVVSKGGTRAERKEAYEKLLGCVTDNNVLACLAAVSADDRGPLADAIATRVAQHNDSVYDKTEIAGEENRPKRIEANYNSTKAQRAAQHRFATLQSQPSLARLFNFVIDVQIPLGAVEKAGDQFKDYAERHGVAGHSRYGFLAASLVCRDATRRVWTATKIRLTNEMAIRDVWACTRAEIDLFSTLDQGKADVKIRDKLIANGALSQIDGVVHIAATRKSGNVTEPRFDIISLDSAQATDNRSTVDIGAQRGLPPLATLRTSGLALVDRWRDAAALMQALHSLQRDDPKAMQVIDADDLTVGYRMDVAVGSNKAGELLWRSLCNRWIEFGDSANVVEPLLARVVPRAEDRLAFDSAIMVMPAKLQKLGLDKQRLHETAFVEDTVGQWTGPPIGVDANSVEIDLTHDDNKHALQLGHSYRLSPDPDNLTAIPAAFKIPKLMFGGGYFFGLTPRLVAGVIRPFDMGKPYQAIPGDALSTEAERNFAILPQPKSGPRRFLRHERIEAPIVTTPEPILARVFDGVVDGLRETADTIVVRSQLKPRAPADKSTNAVFTWLDTDASGQPITTSYRVVVPPTVSAEFADRHGVFNDDKELIPYRDHQNGRWWGPPDGLPEIDYNEPAGGFPVYSFSKTNRGGVEVALNDVTQPSGDAIFRPRQNDRSRRDPYYPDPAASFIVIALRDLAGRLLPGDPLVVPVRPQTSPDPKKKLRYPDVRPIVLEVVAQETRSGKSASHDRILRLRTAKPGSDLTGAKALEKPAALATLMIDGSQKLGSGPIAASHVRVLLEPGDSFEVDMWCLPASDRQLAAWFDVIEAAALVASVDAATGQVCENCTSFEGQLKALKLDRMIDFVKRLGLSRAAADMPMCGPANATIPMGALRCVADIAYKTLQKRPTPELAARRTVTVTHAIAQVVALPSIQLSLSRAPPADGSTPEQASLDGQTVAIAGTVTVDRPTTGLFEILAEGVSLVTNAFDDEQRRRRTPDEVARGIWPRSPVSDELMRVRDVYGFDVNAKGAVTFYPEQAVLLRVEDDLAPPAPGVSGMADRDLKQLQQDSKTISKNGNTVRVNAPFTITDSRARILKLWAIAGARTAGFFRDGKGDIRSDAVADMKSPPQCVVVQATKAPAKVAPLTILPAFRLDTSRRDDRLAKRFVVHREVRLRIRMRRPWFSSGEGERLGIVLWPPDIMKGRIAPSGASVVRDYDTTSVEQADIAMKEFRDDDLGPGGAFTTRWGLDPTKGGGELGWLVPPSAFADLADAPSDFGDGMTPLPDGPVYVPRASVPIPVDDGSGTRRKSRLEAALLTYVPRFDLDHETWFCDVDLRPGSAPEPFMRLGLVRYQPHAPADLRVSEPVVEWLQIPQRRTVTVSINPKQPRLLKVEATGNGSTHSAVAPTGYNPARIESWTQRPVMKISVLRRRANGVEVVADLDKTCDVCVAGYSSRAERTWIPQTQSEWTEQLTLPGQQKSSRQQSAVCATHPAPNSPLSWSAEFALDDDPLKPKVAGDSYAVLVEEVQPMLPATYRDEPVENVIDAPTDRRELTWSGPRFAAIVDLVDDQLASQPVADKAATVVPSKARSQKKRDAKKLLFDPSKGLSKRPDLNSGGD